MIIFLYGQDNFRSRQKLAEIISRHQNVHKSGLNLRFFDFKKDSFEGFRDEFRINPMFLEKKLMVLENSFLNKDFKEKFLDSGKNFVESENVIVFHETADVSKKDRLFVFLKKNSQSQEFKFLEGRELNEWLKGEFKKYNFVIDEGAGKLLLEYVGNDLWRLSNEVRKLVAFKLKSENSKILKEDVRNLVRSKIETDIFKTIDFIAKRDKKKALLLLHKHIEKGDSPLYLLSMINFQFRNLLMIKDYSQNRYPNSATMSKDLKLHPFVVRKGLQTAGNFSLVELKKIYQKIFETDLKIKTGQLGPETALDLLIAEI